MARTIAVIGGGVIGLCSALALERRGADVTLIDAGPPEKAASHVNAGWVVPSLSQPVPAPGLTAQSLRWMLRSDSPLYIAPRLDPDFARWLFAFWRRCNPRDHRAATEATVALGARTLALYDDLRAAGVAFEEHHDGLLYAYRDPAALAHDYAEMESLGLLDPVASPLLDGDAARALELSLSDAIVGGYWMHNERSVRPDSLVNGLRERLARGTTKLRLGERVVGMGGRNGRVDTVFTDTDSYDVEAVVVAAGAWTPQIVAPLGVRAPIEAGKGYSIDLTPPPPLPEAIGRPLYLHESRVAITPLNGMLRLAGTMELSGLNDRIRPERVRALVNNTHDAIRGWPARTPTEGAGVRVWQGARPLTPDGLPIIGWAPGWRNLALASGHAMMGVTLAPATGEVVAELVVTGTPPETIRPLDPARFA
ncbi:MAG: FAD-dependent oxidoreductase [Thermomicrobiales bacterium]|nr:FAD-dependent oxidoreductase [Thermomicrobiales bacterium]